LVTSSVASGVFGGPRPHQTNFQAPQLNYEIRRGIRGFFQGERVIVDFPGGEVLVDFSRGRGY